MCLSMKSFAINLVSLLRLNTTFIGGGAWPAPRRAGVARARRAKDHGPLVALLRRPRRTDRARAIVLPPPGGRQSATPLAAVASQVARPRLLVTSHRKLQCQHRLKYFFDFTLGFGLRASGFGLRAAGRGICSGKTSEWGGNNNSVLELHTYLIYFIANI